MNNFYLNPLEKFRDFYHYPQQEPFTLKKDLLYAISTHDDSATSYCTSITRLCNFENSLYFSTIKGKNAFLDSQIISNTLPLDREHIGIFFALYHFFIEAKYLSVEFDTINSNDIFYPIYNPPKFHWNIPGEFMPIFLSCVIAASKCMQTKEDTVYNAFFTRAEAIFLKALPNYFDIPESTGTAPYLDTFHNWWNDHLAFPFFKTLESMLRKFSNTDNEKQLLLRSVDWLISLLLENTPHNKNVSDSINKLLETYIKKLESQEHSTLYPQRISWFFNDELQNIDKFVVKFRDIVDSNFKDIKEFIQIHHLTNIVYDIAIDNPENLTQKIDATIEELLQLTGEFQYFLYNYFIGMAEHPDIKPYLQTDSLTIDHPAVKKHIDSYTQIINDCIHELISNLSTFKRRVNFASGPSPEKYKTLKTTDSYQKQLEQAIEDFKKRLSQKIKNTEGRLPAPLYFHNKGYIQNQTHRPIELYEQSDVLAIIHALSPCKLYSSEALIHLLATNGYSCPMNKRQLIHLLGDKKLLSQL